MASSTDKLAKNVIDGLSDSRTSTAQAMNKVLEEADRNDNMQAYLWAFVVTYLYNRAARFRIGIMHTPNQEYVAEKCYEMVEAALEQEYHGFDNGIPVSGSGINPPEIKMI